MLVISGDLGCSDEVATVVSMLSVPQVFYRPQDRAEESDAAREKFFVPESDHLTLLNTYLQWQRNSYGASWCERHFVHIKSMRKAREVRSQLVDIMKSRRIGVEIAGERNWDLVRKAICSACFYKSARMKGIGEYTNLLTGVGCNLHPSSALYGLGCVLISPLQLQCAAANFSYQPATLSPHPHLPTQTSPPFLPRNVTAGIPPTTSATTSSSSRRRSTCSASPRSPQNGSLSLARCSSPSREATARIA